MPFRSRAQSKFFFAAEAKGEFPKGTAREWARKTDYKKLPEKVKSKKEKTAAEWIKEAGQSSHRPVSELIKEAQDRMTPESKKRFNKDVDTVYDWINNYVTPVFSPEVARVPLRIPEIVGRLGIDATSGIAQTGTNITGLLGEGLMLPYHTGKYMLGGGFGSGVHPFAWSNRVNRKIHNKLSPLGYRGLTMNGKSWDDIRNNGEWEGNWAEIPPFISEIAAATALPVGPLVGSTGNAMSIGGRGISIAGKGVETTSILPNMVNAFTGNMKGKVIPHADKFQNLRSAAVWGKNKIKNIIFSKPSNPPITDPITKSQLQYISENATNPYNQQFRRMMEQRAIENAPQRAAQMAQSNASNLTSNSASNLGLIQNLRNTWGSSLADGAHSAGSFGGKAINVIGDAIDVLGRGIQWGERPLSGWGRSITPQLLKYPNLITAEDDSKLRGVEKGDIVGETYPILSSSYNIYNQITNKNNSVIKRNNPQQPAN